VATQAVRAPLGRGRWARQGALLLACALAGVALGTALVARRGAERHVLAYEQTAAGVALAGVRADSPVVLDVPGCAGSPACAFLLAKAQLDQADLRGVVASPAHAACADGPCDGELARALGDVRHTLALLGRNGWEDLPEPTPGAAAPLRAPPNGDVDATRAVPSPGSELIVRAARAASPERPLLVAATWPGTTVATAYLTDPGIASSVVVALTGVPAEGVAGDAWASRVLAERLPVVVADQPQPASGRAGDPAETAARLRRELPPGELRDTLLARSPALQRGDVVGDAALLVSLYRPLTWRAVEERDGVVALTDFDAREAATEWFATLSEPALHG
jgi:hypothetical protein